MSSLGISGVNRTGNPPTDDASASPPNGRTGTTPVAGRGHLGAVARHWVRSEGAGVGFTARTFDTATE